MTPAEPSPAHSLLRFELLALYAVTLLAFCNIAVFYSFNIYMERIGIPAEWRGPLLGMEPLAALILRPLISPRLHLRNGITVMAGSLVLIVAALLAYRFATTVPTLALVRLLHGTGFVALVSGATAVFVHFVPPGKSAAAFGVFTIMTQTPFAIMPPFMEMLLRHTDNEAVAYAWISLIMLPALAVLFPLRRRIKRLPEESDTNLATGLARIRESLSSRNVRRLLLVNLLLFMAITTVYFFIKDYALSIRMARPGLFFTFYICAMLTVRAIGSPFFDKLDKRKGIIFSLLLLAACMVLLGETEAQWAVLLLAVIYGSCLGVVMPLLGSAVYLASSPQNRGLNTNLMLSTIDAGYVFGPLLGGTLLAGGLTPSELFLVAVGFAMLASIVTWATRFQMGSDSPKAEPAEA